MRSARLLLPIPLAFAHAGCAELRTLPPPPPPPDLVAGAADPVRGAILAMPAAFGDRGMALAGRPAEAAQALAQLEYVTAAIPRDQRYAPIPEGVRRELVLARIEARDALGVAEDAAPDDVVAGLLGAARALRAGNRPAAAAALPAPRFRPGGAASVARLGDLGPLPQAAIASGVAAQEVARLDAEGRWLGNRPADPNGASVTTFGLGGSSTAGY
jgi:hypothetical protein